MHKEALTKLRFNSQALITILVLVAVVLLFMFNGPYLNFSDETDNFLGGRVITNEGGVLYKDYFSHHMPLPYLLAAPFSSTFGTNLVLMKVFFGLFMGIWVIAITSLLLRKYNNTSPLLLPVSIALTQPLNWSHMLLAETLVAYSLLNALILFIVSWSEKGNVKLAISFGILGAVPTLSSLSYVPISLLIYALGFALIIKDANTKIFKLTSLFMLASLVPYALVSIYLYVNGALTDFISQAYQFNIKYYSQFTPDVATSLIDALFTLTGNFFGGINLVLTGDAKVPILALLFTVSLAAAIYYLWNSRYKLLAAILLVSVMLASSRSGFAQLFSSDGAARHSTPLLFVGLLTMTCVLSEMRGRTKGYPSTLSKVEVSIVKTVILVFLLFMSTFSLEKISEVGRGYGKSVGRIEPYQSMGSASHVINTVNGTSGTYWIGPIDFTSQLVIASKSASRYRFFAPWHGACSECVKGLIEEFRMNNPTVVYLAPQAQIWGKTPGAYMGQVFEYLNNRGYFQLDDPRLEGFFFLNDNKDEIISSLGAAGYQVIKTNE